MLHALVRAAQVAGGAVQEEASSPHCLMQISQTWRGPDGGLVPWAFALMANEATAMTERAASLDGFLMSIPGGEVAGDTARIAARFLRFMGSPRIVQPARSGESSWPSRCFATARKW